MTALKPSIDPVHLGFLRREEMHIQERKAALLEELQKLDGRLVKQSEYIRDVYNSHPESYLVRLTRLGMNCHHMTEDEARVFALDIDGGITK